MWSPRPADYANNHRWAAHVGLRSDLTGVRFLAIGLFLSIVASGVFWFTMTKRLKPRVSFSETITVLNGKNGPRYQVEIRNESKQRSIIEPIIRATFRLKNPSGMISVWNVPVSNMNILCLRPGRQRYLDLKFDELSSFAISSLDRELASMLTASEAGAVEALFALESGGYLEIEMVGTDDLSGTRKYLKSSTFRANDFRRGDT